MYVYAAFVPHWPQHKHTLKGSTRRTSPIKDVASDYTPACVLLDIHHFCRDAWSNAVAYHLQARACNE